MIIHDASILLRRSVQRSGYQRSRRPRTLLLVLSGAWVALLGCSGDATGPVSLPAQQTFWAVRLNYHAINLALTPPYDTVRLTATILNETGTPLAGVDSTVRYSSLDSSVTVDSTGLVTAHSPISSTQVIATLTQRNVTNKDTVVVRVTPTPFAAPLNAFSIQPRPDGLDSAKLAVDYYDANYNVSAVLPVYATIATGNATTDTVCNVNSCALLANYTTSDSDVATIDRFGNINPVHPGRLTLYVSTYAYGVFQYDSLPFTIGYRIYLAIFVESNYKGAATISNEFFPDSLQLGIGGTVTFAPFQYDATSLDHASYVVTFTRSSGIFGGLGGGQAGDSVVVVCDTCSDGGYQGTRTFKLPGKYVYQSASFLSPGVIEVSSGP